MCLENIIVDFKDPERMINLDYSKSTILLKGFGNAKWLEGNTLAQSAVQSNQVNIDL